MGTRDTKFPVIMEQSMTKDSPKPHRYCKILCHSFPLCSYQATPTGKEMCGLLTTHQEAVQKHNPVTPPLFPDTLTSTKLWFLSTSLSLSYHADFQLRTLSNPRKLPSDSHSWAELRRSPCLPLCLAAAAWSLSESHLHSTLQLSRFLPLQS